DPQSWLFGLQESTPAAAVHGQPPPKEPGEPATARPTHAVAGQRPRRTSRSRHRQLSHPSGGAHRWPGPGRSDRVKTDLSAVANKAVISSSGILFNLVRSLDGCT